MPGALSSSESSASPTAVTVLKCFKRAFALWGPTPSIESRVLDMADFFRCCLC